MGGFSIREYVGKVGREDVRKCWPFDGGDQMKKEEIEVLLPPLVFKKFSWWEDKLKEVRSRGVEVVPTTEETPELEVLVMEDEKVKGMMMVCPVCENFKAGSVEAVNKHVDSCLIYASRQERRELRKMKAERSKLPRKRSIAELFTVAEQVQEVESQDEWHKEEEQQKEEEIQEGGGVQQENVKERKNKKKKSRECKEKILSKLKSQVKNKKIGKKIEENVMMKKKKKKKICLEKETCQKFRTPSEFGFSGNPKKTSNTDSIRSQSVEDKLKKIQPFKMCYKKPLQHPVLKKRARATCNRKSLAIGSRRGADCTNIHLQKASKHVHFSGKGDTLGEENNCLSHNIHPQTHNIHESFPDVIAVSSVNVQSEKGVNLPCATNEVAEMNGSESDVTIDAMNDIGVQSMSDDQLDATEFPIEFPIVRLADMTQHNRSRREKGKCPLNESVGLKRNFPRHAIERQTVRSADKSLINRSHREKGKSPLGGSVSLTRDSQHQKDFYFLCRGNYKTSDNPPYAGYGLLNSTPRQGLNPVGETQIGRGLKKASDANRSSSDFSALSFQRFAATDSLLKATLKPSAPPLDITEGNRRHPFRSQGSSTSLSPLQYQCFHQNSPKDSMAAVMLSQDCKNKKAAICGERITDEGFMGLPLNSHGELVKLHSTAEEVQNRMYKQIPMMSSVSSLPIYKAVGPEGSLGYFNRKVTQYPRMTIPKERCLTFPEHTRREEAAERDSVNGKKQFVKQFGLDLNLMTASNCGVSQYTDETENVKLGQHAGNAFCSTQPTIRLMGKDVSVGRSDCEVQESEDVVAFAENRHEKEHDPKRFSNNASISKQFQQECMVNPSSSWSKEAAIHSLEPQSNYAPPRSLQMEAVDPRIVPTYLNQEAHAIRQITDNQKMKMHPFSKLLHSVAPTNRAVDRILNSTQLGFNQHLAYGTPSTFQFPFSCHGECVQPSRAQGPSQNLTQWIQNVNQQKQSPFASQFHPSQNLTQWIQNVNQWEQDPFLSQFHSETSAINYQNTISSNLSASPSLYGTSTNPYLNHQAKSVPPIQQAKSVPPIQLSSGRAPLVQRPLIPVPSGFRVTSSINHSYRRLKLSQYRKHGGRSKKSTKAPADDTAGSTVDSTKTNLGMEVLSSAVMTTEQRENRDVGKGKGRLEQNSPIEIYKDGLRTSSLVNSSAVDGVARPGPVKLSAGVKHILKPRPNSDPEDSRPIHSTIPLRSVSDSGKVSEVQNKSTQVYRF